MACNAVLQSVMRNDEVTRKYDKHLKYLSQGMSLVERDLSQLVDRDMYADQKSTKQYISHESGGTRSVIDADAQGETLIFTRSGWLNPQGMLPRGQIQMVAYLVKENKLERRSYIYPESVLGEEPDKTILYEGVQEVHFRFRENGSWKNTTSGEKMPQAIELEILFEDETSIVRKFVVAKGV